jgi:hypothetical protein
MTPQFSIPKTLISVSVVTKSVAAIVMRSQPSRRNSYTVTPYRILPPVGPRYCEVDIRLVGSPNHIGRIGSFGCDGCVILSLEIWTFSVFVLKKAKPGDYNGKSR